MRWLALTLLLGCSHPAPASAPRSGQAGESSPPRSPDGVFFDLPMALPPSSPRVAARGVVALREPVSREEVLVVVRSYFRAFATGDVAAFGSLVLHDARRIEEGGEAPVLLSSLASRVRGLDYSHISPEAVAAYEEMRLSTYADLPDDVRRADGVREGDVLSDVPVRMKRGLGVRLFGDRVVLVLRRDAHDGSLKIAGLAEEGAPWP